MLISGNWGLTEIAYSAEMMCASDVLNVIFAGVIFFLIFLVARTIKTFSFAFLCSCKDVSNSLYCYWKDKFCARMRESCSWDRQKPTKDCCKISSQCAFSWCNGARLEKSFRMVSKALENAVVIFITAKTNGLTFKKRRWVLTRACFTAL